MADIFDRATRSRVMAAIRGKNTNPERIVRSWLHRHGLRFRLHDCRLAGRPDIVLARHRAVVFVHGCFWHHHAGCRNAVMPKSNRRFWRRKLLGNQVRDRQNAARLRREGWRVFAVWECELGAAQLARLCRRIISVRRRC